MYEFTPAAPRGRGVQTALDEVLNRLHVMIGFAFDALDLGGVCIRDFCCQCIEHRERLGGQALQFHDRRLGSERLEPQRLDAHALPDQPSLTENRPQFCGLVSVAAINGRNRIQCVIVHGRGREKGGGCG